MKTIQFEDRSQMISIATHHNTGGELISGMDILCERNYRTPLIPAKLVYWKVGTATLDITGYGKYANSELVVEINGKNQTWPFTMAYIKSN